MHARSLHPSARVDANQQVLPAKAELWTPARWLGSKLIESPPSFGGEFTDI